MGDAHSKRREAALTLSALVLAEDRALEQFRARRAADKELDLAHFRRARDLLDAVAGAVSGTDRANWERIEKAWTALQVEPEPPDLAETERPPAPRSSPPAASPSAEPSDSEAPLSDTEWAPGDAPPISPELAPSPWSSISASRPAPSQSSPWAAAPRFPAAEADLEITKVVAEGLAVLDSALPFAEGAASLPLSAVDDEPHDASGETAFMRAEPSLQTLPFEDDDRTQLRATPEIDPQLAGLTIEQYAALHALREAHPERHHELRQRFQIRDGMQELALDNLWKQRFEADAKLRASFSEHRERYEEWLKKSR